MFILVLGFCKSFCQISTKAWGCFLSLIPTRLLTETPVTLTRRALDSDSLIFVSNWEFYPCNDFCQYLGVLSLQQITATMCRIQREATRSLWLMGSLDKTWGFLVLMCNYLITSDVENFFIYSSAIGNLISVICHIICLYIFRFIASWKLLIEKIKEKGICKPSFVQPLSYRHMGRFQFGTKQQVILLFENLSV